MAQITWRNVNAPDFSGAISGYEAASRMLSSGLGDASKALGGFERSAVAQNDADVLQSALRYQDPGQLRTALADGSLVGSRRISNDALTNLQGNADRLIQNDAGQLTNAKGVYGFGRTVADNAATDALRPASAALAAAQGNPQATQAIMNAYLPQLAAAPVGTADSLLTAARTAQAGRNTNTQQDVQTNALVRNDAADQAALPIIQDYIRKGGGTASGAGTATELFDRQYAGLDPNVRARVMAALPGIFSAGAGGVPGALGGAAAPAAAGGTAAAVSGALAGTGGTGSFAIAPGTAGHGTTKGSAYDMTVGGVATPKPLTQMSLGEVQDFGKNTLIPGNAGKFGNPAGVGSSASGAYQITGQTLDTYAPKVLGANWKDQPFTPENQDKIAKAIFDDRKGGNLKDTWTSLPNSTPGAYKDQSWDQVKGQITQGEVGGVPGATPAGNLTPTQSNPTDPFTANAQAQQQRNAVAGALTGENTVRGAQENIGSIASKYVAAAGREDTTAGTIADELRSADFKGTSRQVLVKKLTDIVGQGNGKINYAMAGEILKQNTEANNKGGFLGTNITDILPNRLLGNSVNLGNGIRLNDAGVKQSIVDAQTPAFLQQSLVNDQRKAVNAQVDTSKKNLDAAQLALTSIQNRARVQPGLIGTAEYNTAQRAYDQANAAWQASAALAQDPGYKADFKSPKPTAVTNGAPGARIIKAAPGLDFAAGFGGGQAEAPAEAPAKVPAKAKQTAQQVEAALAAQPPVSNSAQQLATLQAQAQALPLASPQRAAVLQQIVQAQMQVQAERPGFW